MTAAIDASRRGLLFGRLSGSVPSPLRPPWAKPEEVFVADCSRCDDCVRACPQAILVRGDGGFPQIDFSRGECTFCKACVQACRAPVFLDPAGAPPWSQAAAATEACFAAQGIYCRSCAESCEQGAIRFALAAGKLPQPQIDGSLCTGCGACVAPCPAQAIRVARRREAA